jgi:hypothetical protein
MKTVPSPHRGEGQGEGASNVVRDNNNPADLSIARTPTLGNRSLRYTTFCAGERANAFLPSFSLRNTQPA